MKTEYERRKDQEANFLLIFIVVNFVGYLAIGPAFFVYELILGIILSLFVIFLKCQGL